MVVKEIKSYDEFKQIINGSKPVGIGSKHEILEISTDRSNLQVVIDFWATWCGPCRFISPIFEKLSERDEFNGVDFYKVDVDEQGDISQEVGIRAMPTFISFKGGEKDKQLVGAQPGELENVVRSAALV